jgi:hypothetical protein
MVQSTINERNLFRLVGSGVDVTFAVTGSIEPRKRALARRMQDPCTGQVTIIRRYSASATPREWALSCYVAPGAERDAAFAELEDAYDLIGPFTLHLPNGTGTVSVVVDASRDFEWEQLYDGGRRVPLTFVEQL